MISTFIFILFYNNLKVNRIIVIVMIDDDDDYDFYFVLFYDSLIVNRIRTRQIATFKSIFLYIYTFFRLPNTFLTLRF